MSWISVVSLHARAWQGAAAVLSIRFLDDILYFADLDDDNYAVTGLVVCGIRDVSFIGTILACKAAHLMPQRQSLPMR